MKIKNDNHSDEKDYELESWKNSSVSKIYPFLRDGLFHRTSIDGYQGIKRSRKILSNSGLFPYTYPQSKYSFGSSKSYISLFDFSSAQFREIISIHHTWGGFFFDQDPVTVVLRLNKKSLSKKLIPNNDAKLDNLENKGYIPYVEAWYPGAIPFSVIMGLIISFENGIDKPPFFQEFSLKEINKFENIINNIKNQYSS